MAGLKITLNAGGARSGYRRASRLVHKAADLGASAAAHALLRESRNFIPVLAGGLRDSGEVIKEGPGKYKLGWSAKSKGGFHYGERQYKEVFQHVDGTFAARWVDRALESDPDRPIKTVAQFVRVALSRGG